MNKIKRLWADRGNQYRYMRWLMQYVRPYIGKISLMMGVNLLSTVITLVMVQVSKKIIDNATLGGGFLSLILIYILLIAGMQIITVVSTLMSTMLTERFSFGIRKQIYEKILNSHWMDVKRYHTGDLMTRLTSDDRQYCRWHDQYDSEYHSVIL